jgi:hypothetical protein
MTDVLSYKVKVTAGGEVDFDDVVLETDAAAAVMYVLRLICDFAGEDGRCDWLSVEAAPENPDAPPVKMPDGEPYWVDVEADEVAVHRESGAFRRWDPDEVERKGGLAPGWVWLSELSAFEVFCLAHPGVVRETGGNE